MESLNKHQTREVSRTLAALPILGTDYAARVLSALHRAAMRRTQQAAIVAIATQHGVTRSPEWIVR